MIDSVTYTCSESGDMCEKFQEFNLGEMASFFYMVGVNTSEY